MAQAAAYIDTALSATGLPVTSQPYQVDRYHVRNIAAESAGTSNSGTIVIVGAHYDTAPNCPGANDNGSGVASLLALASLFAGRKHARTIRFVAFTCEEDPFFQTPDMGSYVYAKACRERGENISAMLSLETIGYYSDKPGSQHNPWPLSRIHGSVANYLLFASNIQSRPLLAEVHTAFRAAGTPVPSHSLWLPGWLRGPSASDQWSFWKHGYPAIMITDTANFRYDAFHTPQDTPDRLCYDKLALVVRGLESVIEKLAS